MDIELFTRLGHWLNFNGSKSLSFKFGLLPLRLLYLLLYGVWTLVVLFFGFALRVLKMTIMSTVSCVHQESLENNVLLSSMEVFRTTIKLFV